MSTKPYGMQLLNNSNVYESKATEQIAMLSKTIRFLDAMYSTLIERFWQLFREVYCHCNSTTLAGALSNLCSFTIGQFSIQARQNR